MIQADSGDEDENVDESKTQNDADDQKTNTPPEIQWTREEDRLLLEQMKAGLDPNVENITGFPAVSRTKPKIRQNQIRNRIDFLIDFPRFPYLIKK